MFITKLKTTLQYKDIINNIFFVTVCLILLLISINHIYIFILLFIYMIYLKNKNETIFKLSIILLCIYFISFLIFKFLYKNKELSEIKGIITNIYRYSEYNKIEVKNKIYKYIVYDYDMDLVYKIGDKIKATGINLPFEKNHQEMMFNNERYLLSNHIVSAIQKKTIEITNDKNIYIIKDRIYNYVKCNFQDDERSFIEALVLGNSKLIDENIKNNIMINGISHLFAISGLHISILINTLEKILRKIKYKNHIINSFLAFYSFITSFSPSILRCVLMKYIKDINKKNNMYLSSLDILCIVFIILLVINPYYMYMTGFILSFLVSFFFIIFSKYVEKFSSLKQSIILSIVSFIGTLPITVNLNNSVNLLSILSNVIFIFITTTVILPMTFIIFLLPFLLPLYEILLEVFIYLNLIFAERISINITLPNFNIIEIIVYYIFLYLILKMIISKDHFYQYKKILYIFIIFFLIYYNKANLNIISEIEFLDLLDGEAILINSKFNKYTILIDTGNGSNDVVSTYLNKKGIRKIDYLIITHEHLDHNGELIKINDEIKVNNIVVSAYYNSVLPKDVNIIKVKKGDKIKIKDITLNILSPSINSNEENDNSIVIGVKLGNYKYLFLGDATNNILDEINYDADIIKAGHHGSKTSASYDLYSKVLPKLVIIQTGRTKKYNFPNKETTDLLKSLKIDYYQTNRDSTIKIYYTKIGSIIRPLW